MPFWKKAPVKQCSDESGTNGVNGDGGKPKEKVDYKARLQHKQYIVSITITLLVLENDLMKIVSMSKIYIVT